LTTIALEACAATGKPSTMQRSKHTILLSGMIAGDPHQGGATWAVMQYWLGLRRLGHEVYFVEPLNSSSMRAGGTCLADSASAAYFRDVVGCFGLAPFGALLGDNHETVGLAYDALCAVARRASLLINISGMLADPELTERIPKRVYLDLDPAFNQLWHAVQRIDMRFAGHTHYATIGLALGGPECRVPTCGHNWIKTLQPVVLEYWPTAERIAYDALTTVGNWRGYGSIEHEGAFYGQKAHSWRPLMQLPKLTRERFMPALAIHPDERDDLAALTDNGWCLVDPARVTRTPGEYQQFIQRSRGEFGVAKSGYVVSDCGWFSDRSVCYLASGRPVIAQETGFSRFLPTGEGLMAFRSIDEVLAAVDRLNCDYSRHARAARRLAEQFFDSDIVLGSLLDRLE
jgi:hypothetical protein